MKIKIQKYAMLFLSATTLIFGACTDLEVEYLDSAYIEQSAGGFEGVDIDAVLNSAYGKLGDIVGSSYTGVSGLNDPTSDEMIIPTRSTDWGNGGVFRELHSHGWDAGHSYILDVWNDLNVGVYYCTQILASNPSASQAAEAKTLRAFFMYNIIDLFGQVPFREVNEGVDDYPVVWTRSQAFDYAVSDLETAISDLPEGGPGYEDLTKMTQAFAHALLARFYLNKAVYEADVPAGPYSFDATDMNKVIEHCDAVDAMGFDYETNYFDNFNATGNSEKILIYTRWWNGMWIWPQLHNSQGGWNGATTLGSFYDKFEDSDQRIGTKPETGIGFGILVGPQLKTDGTPYLNRGGEPLVYTREILLSGNPDYAGYRVLKYDPNSDGGFVLMRYADVRLMKAEAILRGGSVTNGETAQSIVDELRAVRGASQMTASLDMLLDERGREMYWEGIRRTDQIRFETFTKTTWEQKTLEDDNKVLFPIPQQAMDSNPNFTQNPGYK